MIAHEPMDQTTLNIMEVYRRQVTDLKERLHYSEERRQYAEDNYEPERQRVDSLREELKTQRDRAERSRATAMEMEQKVAKLEGVIESLKIELQDERAAHTKTKEGSDDR
ncbi:hypothetical protein [Corynebacterium sp. AOP40-4SA-5]|uniref:hypothetical protein n=1 Tax=Corynebacterium sp. AOP40-4SA-5 TaxID=3457678 RepID=UPI00403428BC